MFPSEFVVLVTMIDYPVTVTCVDDDECWQSPEQLRPGTVYERMVLASMVVLVLKPRPPQAAG